MKRTFFLFFVLATSLSLYAGGKKSSTCENTETFNAIDSGEITTWSQEKMNQIPCFISPGDRKTVFHLAKTVDVARTLWQKRQKNRLELFKKDIYGFNPLHYACYNGNVGLVVFYLEAGISADIVTDCEKQETPLHIVVERLSHYTSEKEKNKFYDILVHLLSIGADQEAKDALGKKVIQYAQDLKVDLLFTIALKQAQTQAKELSFKEEEKEIWSADEKGFYPIHHIVESVHDSALLEKLLSQFSEQQINQKTVKNRLKGSNFEDTPLHLLVYLKRIKAIETLITYGANPDIRNKQGVSPRDRAKEYNFLLFFDRAVQNGMQQRAKRLDRQTKNEQTQIEMVMYDMQIETEQSDLYKKGLNPQVVSWTVTAGDVDKKQILPPTYQQAMQRVDVVLPTYDDFLTRL